MIYLLVSYDISDDHRRSRVAKLLEDHGTRVQYSVFECLLNENEIVFLQETLQEIIAQETDSVRFYRICRRCQQSIEIFGRGTTQTYEPFKIL